ncbi:MAG: hypothetical protein ACLFV4_11840 [Candidatus Hydrogenedentota bacterium]
MTTKKVFATLAVALLVCLMFGFVGEAAHAQDYMEQEGLGGLAESGGLDEEKMPEKWQMGLGLGSIFVMIAVLKWL